MLCPLQKVLELHAITANPQFKDVHAPIVCHLYSEAAAASEALKALQGCEVQQDCQSLVCIAHKFSQCQRLVCIVLKLRRQAELLHEHGRWNQLYQHDTSVKVMRQVTYPTEMVQEGGDEILGLAHLDA